VKTGNRRAVVSGFRLAAGVGMSLPTMALADVSYQLVAKFGDQAPDTPSGVSYGAFSPPLLNNAGQISYSAELFGNGVTEDNRQAIFAGLVEAPRLIARRSEQAPGVATGVTYSRFDELVGDRVGAIAYNAEFVGGGVTSTNNEAIYVTSIASSNPQVAVRSGDTAPGTPAGVTFAGFRQLRLNNVGHVSFVANLNGGITEGLFFATPAGAQIIARTGAVAPGTGGSHTYSTFLGATGLNASSQVAFRARLGGSGLTSSNDTAIFAGDATNPQLVARAGSQAHGVAAGVNYSSFLFQQDPDLDDSGIMAFRAAINGPGVTAANNSVIYMGTPSSPQLVLRTGTQAPGLPAGVNFSVFGVPELNSAGQIALAADLTGPGVTLNNEAAIFAGSPSSLSLIAREGIQVPGASAGVQFASFGFPALNDIGQGAFSAVLRGTGVATANDNALFAFDPTLGTVLIAREGDLFNVNGELRTIQSVGFLENERGLNDLGQLAFGLSFTDGTNAIFVASIPEPTGLALLALAGSALCARRRR
jgi:hypothetical protein